VQKNLLNFLKAGIKVTKKRIIVFKNKLVNLKKFRCESSVLDVSFQQVSRKLININLELRALVLNGVRRQALACNNITMEKYNIKRETQGPSHCTQYFTLKGLYQEISIFVRAYKVRSLLSVYTLVVFKFFRCLYF
jgi:hypothetical protein